MRKYRVLFVDDEEVSRKSFQTLVDWEAHSVELVGVLKDGEQALEFLKEFPVDILVTDINMPFVDGIELLKNVRDCFPQIRVILLTGYEFFEYARKAIELKAFDFLLKPITQEKLVSAIEKAQFDIEKEEADKMAVDRGLEVARGDFVVRLFNQKIEKERVREQAEKVNIDTENHNYLVFCCALDVIKGDYLGESARGELKAMVREEILRSKRRLEQEMGFSCQAYLARNVGINLNFLLVSEREIPIQEFAEEWTKRLLNKMSAQYPCHLTFGVGRVRSRLENIADSYEKVTMALRNRHILGLGKVIYSTDALPERKNTEEVILPTEELLNHIRYGMTSQVEQDIQGIYEKFGYDEYLSLPSARAMTTELAITAFKGETSSDGDSVSYLYFLNQIQQMNTLEEMKTEILKFAVGVAEKRKNSGSHKKRIADQALTFLQENYHKEELSLNDVADHLGISIPYLAVLFKQETGKNFGAHLLDIRMKKAKELLKTTDSSISDIAEQVGYNSPQYFAVCFKKYAGVTPGNYRNQM